MSINERDIRSAANTLKPVLLKFRTKPDQETEMVLNAKEQVFSRYQYIFSPEHIDELTEEEFKSFLLYKNNCHWRGLHRQGGFITQDMDLLQKALSILVDESRPVAERLDQLLPSSGAMVPHLGKGVLTPILMITKPEKYGVWNNTSEAGLRALDIWPHFERGTTFGERYTTINQILTALSQELYTDFWDLDTLWWGVIETGDGEDGPEPDFADTGGGKSFGLERYLQEFLAGNWEQISDFREWVLHEEYGDIVGMEYNTGIVGRIDLLAHHKTEPRWLVIELKRDQGSDETLGQVQRYMGWVSEELGEEGDHVEGLIICRSIDEHLRYALKNARDVKVMLYEVEFRLRNP